jgi:hypothetical protein
VSEIVRSPLNPLAPTLSAIMCDGMGWFSNNDFKRMLLFYDQILYLVPSRTAEFEDVDGQPKYIMFSKRRQEIGFHYQRYEPDDVMADLLLHAARLDAERRAFASIIAGIPEEDRIYTWRVTNADADLGRGSSVALHPNQEVIAHALLLNKFLVAADLLDAVPITGKPYIHALVCEKYQAAQATLNAEREAPIIPNPSLNPIAIQVINAIVTDDQLERRSEIEIVEYKEKHRQLFDMFSYTVRKLVKQVSALPGSPDFERQVAELVNTEVWRDKMEVERELRDGWEGFFKSAVKSAVSGAVGLGITPFLHLGQLSIASALAGVAAGFAAAAPWATSEFVTLLEKRKQAKRHGVYYLLNFK